MFCVSAEKQPSIFLEFFNRIGRRLTLTRESSVSALENKEYQRRHLARLHLLVMFFMAALQGQLLALTFYDNRGRSPRVVLFGLSQ